MEPPGAPYVDNSDGSEISVVDSAAIPTPRTVNTVPHQPAKRSVPSPRFVIARRFWPVPIDSALHTLPLKCHTLPVLPTV